MIYEEFLYKLLEDFKNMVIESLTNGDELLDECFNEIWYHKKASFKLIFKRLIAEGFDPYKEIDDKFYQENKQTQLRNIMSLPEDVIEETRKLVTYHTFTENFIHLIYVTKSKYEDAKKVWDESPDLKEFNLMAPIMINELRNFAKQIKGENKDG